MHLLKSCLLHQNPPALGPPAVPGTVLRGHSLSAGHGVLPHGETHNEEIHYFLSLYFFVWIIAKWSEQLPTSFPFSSQGDLKSYMRSCQVADSEMPEPLILQRMVCDIASGLVQLHKYNFIHRSVYGYLPAFTCILMP